MSKERKIIPIYRAEAFLIPLSRLEPQEIEKAEKRFTYRFYKESSCKKCDHVGERHSDICDSCSAFVNIKQLAKVVEKGKNNKPYLSLPSGASKKVKKWLRSIGQDENYEMRDSYEPAPDFSRRIRFTGTLYAYQLEACEVLIKKKRGVLESLPRTGKTVMAVKIICELGKKALVLGAQKEWLSQFRDTFLGSDTQPGFTNAKPRQIVLCEKEEDFHKADVALATFSTFMSKAGRAKLERLRNLFHVVFVDEVHGGAALQTSKIISRFNAPYYFGLSGTVERKQEGEIEIVHDLIGPILHTCKVERLRAQLVPLFPKVTIADPKGGGQTGFTYFQSRLESNTTRRQIILKEAIRLARQGHLVLIPLTRVSSILKWTQEINAETERAGFALPFYGGLKKDRRKDVIEKAKNYECKILVGNIALLSTGLNIPRASCIMEIGATSNLPKAKQRMARILTPMEGKPTPLIVYVLDDSDLIKKCRRNEFWNAVKPNFDPMIYKDDMNAIMSYFAGREHTQTFNFKEGM